MNEQVTAAIQDLRNEIQGELLQMNNKFDAVKIAQDANDGQLKSIVNQHADFINGEFANVKTIFALAEDRVKAHDTLLQQITAEVNSLRTTPGTGINTGPSDGGVKIRAVMEYKAIQSLEKLTNDPGAFVMWNMRFKNAVVQVNPKYKELLAMSEQFQHAVPTYEYWKLKVFPGIVSIVQNETETLTLSHDLYTVLVDKCTDSQIMRFANEDDDGFYAFFNLYRSFRMTAGVGLIEKSNLVMHPKAATKDSENYDAIVNWEREMHEQEKLLTPEKRPLMSTALKGAVLKRITVGSVKEYIKTHEAIKEYEDLRNDVLTIAMYTKTEENTNAHKATPMDLSAVVKRLNDELLGQKNMDRTSDNAFSFGCSTGPETEKASETDADKAVASIMALIKGKGKGKSNIECYNCGKTGHMAKDCWAPRQGYGSKGDKSGKGNPRGRYQNFKGGVSRT